MPAHEIPGSDRDPADQVPVHISALRNKLEANAMHRRLLVTVLGVGFRLDES